MSSPCPKCQVRPDVACKHRPADPDWRNVQPEKRYNEAGPRGMTGKTPRRKLV